MNDPMLVGALGVCAVMVLFWIVEQALLWHARRADARAGVPAHDTAAGLDEADAAIDAAKAAISVARESLAAGR